MTSLPVRTKRKCSSSIIFALTSGCFVGGFAPVTRRSWTLEASRGTGVLRSKLFGPEDDFHDEIGRIEGEDAGKDLTNDFYEEMRRREEKSATAALPKVEDDNTEKTPEKQSSSSFMMGSNEASSLDETSNNPLPKKKFTGQRDDFYAQRPPGASTGGKSRTPREIMMEREYQLVGRAERGIFAQALVAVLALAFYIYVGMSGGIVSGRDAQTEDFGGADEEIPFEQLMPVQRDREVSVWL